MSTEHSAKRNGLALLAALLLAFACAFVTTQVAWAAGEGEGEAQGGESGQVEQGADQALQGQVVGQGATQPAAAQQQAPAATQQAGQGTGQGDQQPAASQPGAGQEQASGAQQPEQPAGQGEDTPQGQATPQGEQSGQQAQGGAQQEAAQQAAGQVQPQSQATTQAEPLKAASLSITAHVQKQGTKRAVKAGVGSKKKYARVGTTGKGLRVEAVWIKLSSPYSGHVQYQVHVQNVGWQTVRADGKIAGTTGKALRIEGIRIALVGEVSKYYNVNYRAHVQNKGWLDWKSNGAYAGTTGEGLRVEAIDIFLSKKKGDAGTESEGIVGLVYRGRVQSVGNQAWVANGGTAGTTGRSLRLEKATLYLSAGKYAGSKVMVMGHVQNKGWTNGGKYVAGSKGAGTAGKGLRLEALRVKLTGDIADVFDVEYRVHVQSQGWQGWAVNGGLAGTTGKGLRIEALQVRLVRRDASGGASLSEGTYVVTFSKNAGSELKASGAKVAKGGFSRTAAAGKFYVRPEGGGYTLQSVSTGKFLSSGGELAAWKSGSKALVWKLSRLGGVRLTNAGDGKMLDVYGTGHSFASVNLVNDGSYIVKNGGKALDVSGASFSNGANIMIHNANGGGNQVFQFKNGSGGWMTVTNVMTRKRVDVAGGKKGANVRQWTANSSGSQRFKAQLGRDGSMYFVNKASGQALTAETAGKSGANVKVAGFSKYAPSAKQKWTLEAGSWSLTGDPALDEYVLRIANQNGKDLHRCFNWMQSLSHVQTSLPGTISGIFSASNLNRFANYVRTHHAADCYADAAMFCWLARACGYNANARGGGCPSASGGTVPHGWTEVYINGTTYICDANLRRDLPGNNWYMVTYASAPVSYSIW